MALSNSKLTTLEVAGDGTNDRAQGYVGSVSVSRETPQLAAVDVTGIVAAGVVLPPAGLKKDGVADVCVAGECLALVDGTTDVDAGDLLDTTDAGTFVQTALTGKNMDTAITAGEGESYLMICRAVAMEAYADSTPALKRVYILNNPIGAAS